MVKVGSRVVEFGAILVVGTGAALGISRLFSPSEEEKERLLRERYPDLVKQSEGSKKQMQAFFDTIKANPNDSAAGAKFDDLLKSGKGAVKNQSTNRLVEIDPSTVSDPNHLLKSKGTSDTKKK